MKLHIIAFCLLAVSCSSTQKENPDDSPADRNPETTAQGDSSILEADSVEVFTEKDNGVSLPFDSSLFFISREILLLIQENNDTQLIKYFHPVKGVRFSPYSYADTLEHQKFLAHEFLKAGSGIFTWGNYAGSGEPIVLSRKKYFAEFVYDVDFINLSTASLNEFKGFGNTINNVEEVYKGCPYVEYYFPGEMNNESFTWKSVTLVFEKYKGKYYLIAITHGEWTI